MDFKNGLRHRGSKVTLHHLDEQLDFIARQPRINQ